MTDRTRCRLGDVVMPVETWNPQRVAGAGRLTYVDLSAVDHDSKRIVAARSIHAAEAPSRARQLVAAHDVLVSTVRPNLNGVAIVPEELAGATASTGFCVLRAQRDRLHPGYLFYWVQSRDFVDDMTRKATGASYPAVSDKVVHDSPITLPLLCEQQRIVEVLDRAEALRAKRHVSLALVDRTRSALFDQLFQIESRAPVDIGDHPGGHRAGWRWEVLTSIARLATGHTPDRKRASYWNGDVPWITLTDVRRLDGTVAYEAAERISQAGIDNSAAVRLPPGTVCFSRTASVGFVTIMGREMATSQDFVNWICGPRLEPIYLMHALLRSRNRLRALSTGSTHKTIYFPTVEQFRVLVPPIELQREFVARANTLDALKERCRASQVKLNELFASLQHRAFGGEL